MAQVLSTNATNLALDYLFMGPMGMGVAGAAAATLVGTVAGILVGLRYLLSSKRTFRFIDKQGNLKETVKTIGSSSGPLSLIKFPDCLGFDSQCSAGLFCWKHGCGTVRDFWPSKFIIRILVGGTSKTISSPGSLLYGEKDFYGIRKMMSIIFRYTYVVVVAGGCGGCS